MDLFPPEILVGFFLIKFAAIENASQQGEAFSATNYKSAEQLDSLLLASSQPNVLTHNLSKPQEQELINALDSAMVITTIIETNYLLNSLNEAQTFLKPDEHSACMEYL